MSLLSAEPSASDATAPSSQEVRALLGGLTPPPVELLRAATAPKIENHGVDPDTLSQDQRVRALVQAAIDDVNNDLAQVEKIKKFEVLPRPLSIEDGELTPTMKVKRSKVSEHFAELIDSMYA